MKYLNRFNENIIDFDSDNIRKFYNESKKKLKSIKNPTLRSISFDEVVSLGEKNNIEVVNYDTFYKELPDNKKRGAPPRHAQIFAMVNEKTLKARIILNTSKIDEDGLDLIYHMLKHENVHIGQKNRRPSDKELGGDDVSNAKKYFSDPDEIMAFAQSISDKIMSIKPKTIKDAMSKIDGVGLYRSIKHSVDKKVLDKYKKYIYLYLQKEFDNK